jgi:hypothetical protein
MKFFPVIALHAFSCAGASTHIIKKNEEGKPALILRHPDYETDKKARNWRVQLSTPAVRAEGECARLNVSGNIASDPRRSAIGAKAFDVEAATKSIVRDHLEP